MLISIYMGLHPRWPEYSCSFAITTATMATFSHRTLSMHSNDVTNSVVIVLSYSGNSFTSVAAATEEWGKVQRYLLWGPSSKDHTQLLQEMMMLPYDIACYVVLHWKHKISKTASRGAISHLSKYTVILFIHVPSSCIKLLFHSSLVWRMYCRQCRCDNNGKTTHDSIAVATSRVVINRRTKWQF